MNAYRAMVMRLDCGHFPQPKRWGTGTDLSGIPGYALTLDGYSLCYSCADDDERAVMSWADQLLAYVSGDGRQLQTWTGGELARVITHSSFRGGWHRSEIHAYRFRAPDGSEWHGRNAGPGMAILVRRVRA